MRASTLLLVAAACLCVIIGVDAVAPGAHKLHKSQSARAHQPIHVRPPDLPPGAELLFTRPNRVFPSSAAAHVEPVLNYRVRHEDNQHLHTVENLHPASQHPLKIANAVNSIGAHSLKMRWRDGLKQPFPNSIFVGFRAFDQDFLFHNLQLDTKLYAKDAKMELHGENGEVTFLPMSHNTYITSVQVESREGVDSAGWAVCTIGEDGLLTATINMGQETYQVNPLYIHANEFEEEHYNALKSHAVHNLVITRHSDMTHLKTGGHQCGAAKPRTQQRDPTNTTQTDELTEDDITWAAQESTNLSINLSAGSPEEQEIEIEEEEPLLVSSARRRLMAYPPGYGITRYTNCYSGDTTAHKMSIGITVDVGYYEIYASAQNVANSISNMLASVNGVYVAQFNIFLELQGTIIKSASDGTSWNLKPDAPGGRCSSTAIDVLLNSVTSFRSGTNPKTNSLWHHLTACYPAPGTVGLAWVGTLCHSSYSTGVSSWTGSLWLTVAHEIGHNTGANHAFQEGQGTTGGIMDYGDGIYPLNSGIYQFNPKYAQTDQCALFAKTVTVPGFSPYCWASYAP